MKQAESDHLLFPIFVLAPLMMLISQLDYSLPPELIALVPARPSRVLWSSPKSVLPQEIVMEELLNRFIAGDVLVINETKVLRRRVFAESGEEVLFLGPLSDAGASVALRWQVLMPCKHLKLGDCITLTPTIKARLIEKGVPQAIEFLEAPDANFFDEVAEVPIPPYIQNLRETRRARDQEEEWYQTAWAKEAGSLASPTASLHFSEEDLKLLQSRGVRVEKLILHVGMGTFAPVKVESLSDHKMHEEKVLVRPSLRQELLQARSKGGRVWTLGTTVVRALESDCEDGFTNLLIQPPYQFKYVDVLMTNFHQPRSTLLALVMAFYGEEPVRAAYQWAMDQKFRFLSYGDLSVWEK